MATPPDLGEDIAYDWYCFIAWASRTANFWRVFFWTGRLSPEAYRTHLCSVAYIRECHSLPWRCFYRLAEKALGPGHCKAVYQEDRRG